MTAYEGGRLRVSGVREVETVSVPREEKSTLSPMRGRFHGSAIIRSYWGQLALALLLAIGARLVILITAHGMMDGDEAVLGIQAERILQGAHPIYFAGQAYMGTWDAYLFAPLIALFGPSAWTLHLVTLAESLLLVPLLGALAARLYGARARLPAMLLAAIPPEYVAVGELRMLGGYVETLVLGTALLLLAVVVAERWRVGRSTRWQWLLIGLLTGLALWIDVLIAYYLVAGALWLLPHALIRARRDWRDGWRWARGVLVTGALSGGTLLIGAFPAVIYALQNHLINVQVVLAQPRTASAYGLTRKFVLVYLVTHDLPSVFGLRLLWHTPPLLALALEVVAGLGAVAALAFGTGQILRHMYVGGTAQRRVAAVFMGLWARWNGVMPLLLLGACIVFYWRSPRTLMVYTHPTQDAGGRYVLPATTALSLLLAGLFVSASGWWARHRQDARHRVRLSLAPVLLVLLLTAYALPYLASDNMIAMRSPETNNMVFPAEDTELLTYLDQQHIRYVWSNNWLCHLTMYLEDQRVTCGDYVDVFVYKSGPNRFPDAMAATAAADRPSFIFNADPAQGEPAVERALDTLDVTYTSWHIGSIWVITPLSRTVRPQEIAWALQQDY